MTRSLQKLTRSSAAETSPRPPRSEPALPPVNRPRRLIGSARRSRPNQSLPASRAPGLLLTVEQIAERCAVSTRTTRRWIDTGALRAHHLGHLVRVSDVDLAAFLAAHRDP